jgi:hypothetical protein
MVAAVEVAVEVLRTAAAALPMAGAITRSIDRSGPAEKPICEVYG